MDKISVLGLLFGIVAIIGGQLLEGGHIASLSQPTALLIVLGVLGAWFAVDSWPLCAECGWFDGCGIRRSWTTSN